MAMYRPRHSIKLGAILTCLPVYNCVYTSYTYVVQLACTLQSWLLPKSCTFFSWTHWAAPQAVYQCNDCLSFSRTVYYRAWQHLVQWSWACIPDTSVSHNEGTMLAVTVATILCVLLTVYMASPGIREHPPPPLVSSPIPPLPVPSHPADALFA